MLHVIFSYVMRIFECNAILIIIIMSYLCCFGDWRPVKYNTFWTLFYFFDLYAAVHVGRITGLAVRPSVCLSVCPVQLQTR